MDLKGSLQLNKSLEYVAIAWNSRQRPPTVRSRRSGSRNKIENPCNQLTHLSWEELERLLLSLCDIFDHNFILIDALDEVNIFQERERLLSAVRVLQDASAKTFITSRPNLEDIKI
jgi:hypothetical protein